MNAAVAIFPTLKRAGYGFREVCNFDTEGYHQQQLAAPGGCLVFQPANRGYYGDERERFNLQEAVRSELRRPGSNLAAFKVPRPQLRLCFEGGDWVVWAFLPGGQRLPLTKGAPARDWGQDELYAMQEALKRETGVRFEVIL